MDRVSPSLPPPPVLVLGKNLFIRTGVNSFIEGEKSGDDFLGYAFRKMVTI